MTPPLRRTLYWLPAVAVAATIVWLSHQPRLPVLPGGPPDWLLHGVAYGVFTAAIACGASDGFRRSLRRATRVPWFVAGATLFGILDEFHQSTVPGRDPSVGDVAADVVGAVVVAILVVAWWRRTGD